MHHSVILLPATPPPEMRGAEQGNPGKALPSPQTSQAGKGGPMRTSACRVGVHITRPLPREGLA